MKLTKYGFLSGLALFVSLTIMGHINWVFLFAIFISVILQNSICSECKSTYVLISFFIMTPLLFLVLIDNCEYLKKILIGISFGLAIGRIGCYFAGCCTGKECDKNFPLALKYSKGSVLFDKYKHKITYVYPTILLEILFQLLIGIAVYFSKFGIQLFGILNAGLIILTHFWRRTKRITNVVIPIFSLLFFSVISYYKCKPLDVKIDLKFNYVFVLMSILLMVIMSNDINVNNLKIN